MFVMGDSGFGVATSMVSILEQAKKQNIEIVVVNDEKELVNLNEIKKQLEQKEKTFIINNMASLTTNVEYFPLENGFSKKRKNKDRYTKKFF